MGIKVPCPNGQKSDHIGKLLLAIYNGTSRMKGTPEIDDIMRRATAFVRGWVFAFLPLAALPIVQTAQAADCAPQRLVASVDLVETNGELAVPVTINKVDTLLWVTPDLVVTSIFHNRREALGLRPDTVLMRTSVKLGPMQSDEIKLFFPPLDLQDSPGISGMLGGDILRNFDLDLDLPDKKLNLFDPNHCPGKVIYWKTSAVAAIATRHQHNGSEVFDMTLDGNTVTVTISELSNDTTMSQSSAHRLFNIDIPKKNPDGSLPASEHRFSNLVGEGIAITNPLVKLQHESSGEADMRLGLSVLGKLHIYIAYKEHMVYITTPLAEPVSAPTPAP